MSQVREQARRALCRLALPVPQRERTLRVVVPKGVVPAFGIRCLCVVPAKYAWRTAHENGCSRIVVEDGTGHKHEFQTIDLLNHMVRTQLGVIPAPKRVNGRVPRMLATAGHEALGNHLDTTRPTFTVAAAVSGDTSAAKEE